MPVIVNDWYTRVSFVASEVSYNIGAVNERESEREREGGPLKPVYNVKVRNINFTYNEYFSENCW
jgi:hypothetical protein